MRMPFLFAALANALLMATAVADPPPPLASAPVPPPGHSLHGETFNEGPRQSAVLIEGCGKVVFPITTTSETARRFFLQGVGQLHGFWYYEAERSFRQVAAIDPDCAMAYWGCAMANVNNEKRALGFLAQATSKKAAATSREQAWIASLENFYRDLKKEKRLRHLDFIKDLEGLVHDDPADLEAKAFLAWEIWAAKDSGVTMSSRESVDALLMQIFAKEPMHPARHYHIHLWDDQKPARALVSAALCGQTSPAIAHMWHMPGHTFSKSERHTDAAWQQDAAIRVDHAYMIRTQVLPDQIHNYAHNGEWLVRTYSALGRAQEATALARSLIEIPRHPTWNYLQKTRSTSAYGRTRLLETLLKFELWDEVLQLEGSPYLDSTTDHALEAGRLQALGIADFFKGDLIKLKTRLASVEKLKPATPPAPKPAAKPAEKPIGQPQEKTVATKPAPTPIPAPATAPQVTPPGKGQNKDQKESPKPDMRLVNVKAELALLVALMEKKPVADLKKLFEAAKETPKERLVRYQVAAGNQEKALALAGELPTDAPGQAIRMDVLDQYGRKAEIMKQFENVRKIAAMLDPDLPFSRRLDQIAAKIGCPLPWRRPEAARPDSGVRPPLDSLGPVYWHPSAASPFILPDPANYPVALRDFGGKPVIVLFYLGHQCIHCVEQLRIFSSAASDFKSSGIEIIAIGSEEPASLTATAQAIESSQSAAASLHLLADPQQTVFRQWRCYDDFEGMPLHGAFLVDASGQVRWMDISHTPFTNVKFLLQECQRLLKLHPEPLPKMVGR